MCENNANDKNDKMKEHLNILSHKNNRMQLVSSTNTMNREQFYYYSNSESELEENDSNHENVKANEVEMNRIGENNGNSIIHRNTIPTNKVNTLAPGEGKCNKCVYDFFYIYTYILF